MEQLNHAAYTFNHNNIAICKQINIKPTYVLQRVRLIFNNKGKAQCLIYSYSLTKLSVCPSAFFLHIKIHNSDLQGAHKKKQVIRDNVK